MKIETIIVKNFKIKNDPNYSYNDSNEYSVLVKHINKHNINGYCGLNENDIYGYKEFKNSVHVYVFLEYEGVRK